MKQFLLLSIITIFSLSSLFSQITVKDAEDNLLLDGQSYNLPIQEPTYNGETGFPFIITNTASSQIKYIVEVLSYQDQGDEASFGVCAGGTCSGLSGTDPITIGAPTTLAAGASTLPAETHIQYFGDLTMGDFVEIHVYQEGNTSNSVTFTLNTSEGVSVNNISKNNISVYPNPASAFINIEGDNYDKVIITNISGQIIRTIPGSERGISVANLPNGTYFYQVISKGKISNANKIIVRK